MILFASQRGRSAELAAHLLNAEQNEHVAVHDIRGFVADTLPDALREAYAVSRGTRCKQFLFSLSLNPPETADVPVKNFEDAIEAVEKKLGLDKQPRVIVFHEKNGRRHCHAVWSRIDADNMVAVKMSHFKRKLMDVSRDLYLKYGWKMPKGMEKGQAKAPLHLTREEYRQAVRLTEDPQGLKAMFKTAWERSDSKETFIRALEENGLLLARGDKRGFVAVDIKGGVFSLTRWLDIGTRDLKARLGKPETLPDMAQAKAFLATRMTENLSRFIADSKEAAKRNRAPLIQELRSLVQSQREERQSLTEAQQARWVEETRQRTSRLCRGVAGIWQRMTGEYQKIKELNEAEAKAGLERDRAELHKLVRAHLLERQEIQKTVLFYKAEHRQEVFRLRQEIARFVTTATEPQMAPVAKVEAGAMGQQLPLAAQLAQVETKIALLSGDLSLLQASLENNTLSDEMRARIRRIIEKTKEILEQKFIEKKVERQKQEEKKRDIQLKQAEFNEAVRRYAEIQLRMEAELRQQAANREFYSLIANMGTSLNGIPLWKINVMMLESNRLDERAFMQTVRQQDNQTLRDSVFKSAANESDVSRRPPVDPPMAAPNLRASVLQMQEMLARAGIRPVGGATSRMVPTPKSSTKGNFNSVKR